MICGVDEAGRGSLIGPMVIAFVCVDDESKLDFVKKDSKQLTKKQREFLFDKIKKIANFYVFKIQPNQIDSENINRIELKTLKKFVNEYKPSHMYIDLFEPNTRRLEKYVSCPFTAKHKGDEIFPVVRAASIIAKVIRDREIENISKIVGNFGSGYPSDPITKQFVEAHYTKIEPYIRKKWKTNINKEKNLLDYF